MKYTIAKQQLYILWIVAIILAIYFAQQLEPDCNSFGLSCDKISPIWGLLIIGDIGFAVFYTFGWKKQHPNEFLFSKTLREWLGFDF